ncbi:hypothetical protein MKW94_003163 [Papaver nudicaule]|uniref:MADS-box domain-containing protein n=1 Tax=Papaver nudicaule TaxID=74823 RepID=A0AA41VWH2_PAPNU|nr:hypothetical protein [Papaver nudicaule]
MGKGRRRIEITKIEDRQKRNVTFTKRRQGLFKKAAELSRFTGADVSIIVFSPGGNPFTFSSSPSNDLLFSCNAKVEDEEVDAGDGFWWDKLKVSELDTVDKLIAVRNQLLEVKEEVAKRKKDLLAKSIPVPAATADSDLGIILSEAYDDSADWLDGLVEFPELPTHNLEQLHMDY